MVRRSGSTPSTTSVWDAAFDGLDSDSYRPWRDGRRSAQGHQEGVIGALLTLALLLGAVAAVVHRLAAGGSAAPRCDPITYAVDGDAPPYVEEELSLAIDEIGDVSGLVFATAVVPGHAQLRVGWAEDGIGAEDVAPWLTVDEGARIVGASWGSWQRTKDGAVLVAAGIDVDGSMPWRSGLERGDALAAVFVHELGHVLGLAHSDDGLSFMRSGTFPRRPQWTTAERRALAEIGREAGCLPAA